MIKWKLKSSKNIFSVNNINVWLLFNLESNLILSKVSKVIFTLILLVKKVKFLFISLISYIPGFKDSPVLFVRIYFRSYISITSSYVNCILYNKFSRSFYFAFFNSLNKSFLRESRSDSLYSLSLFLFDFLFS